MKIIIYLILTALCVVNAETDAVDRDLTDDFDGENHRNLRTFRTNVRTCPDNSECDKNDDCEWGACAFRTKSGAPRAGYTRRFKTCRDGSRCSNMNECERGGCTYREVTGTTYNKNGRRKTCRDGDICSDHCEDSSSCKFRHNQWD